MNAQVGFDGAHAHSWNSVCISNMPLGYEISETPDRFAAEHLTELVIRSVGIVLVIAAYGQLLLALPLMTKIFLLVAYSATGLGLYAFATRGFRKAVKVNLATMELKSTKLNGNGATRIEIVVPFADIESIYVRRPAERGGQARLELRKRGIPSSICLLRGREGEVAALHQRLCRDLRMAAQPQATRKAAKARLFAQRVAA